MLTTKVLELKQRLAAGEVACGVCVSISSPWVFEIVAETGFDWVLVDAEHALFNAETLAMAPMAFKGTSTVPIIRVPENSENTIKQVLDAGWGGVLVPRVDTVEQAQRAVNASKYPPLGARGFAPRRVTGYYKDTEEYLKIANESSICAIQAESATAVENIEEIVKVPGIDWVFIGPNDMSGTIGEFRNMEHPELEAAVKKVVGSAQAAGLPGGGYYGDTRKLMEMGGQLVFIGEDLSYLRESAEQSLVEFRQLLAEMRD